MRQIKSSYIITFIITMLLLTGMASCKRKSVPGTGSAGPDELPIVMVEELAAQDLNEYINVSGKLEGSGDIIMVSETTGRLLKLYKKLGDRISKGERLGMTDNEILRLQVEQAEAAKLSAESALENARLNLTASENLYQRQSISEAEYNGAVTAFKAAKAAADGARAGLEAARRNYDNSFLTAPVSGVISKLMAVENQYLTMGTQIAYITDNQNLVIKTGVGESQVTRLNHNQPVEITVPGNDKTVKGVISGIGSRPLPGAANYSLEIRLLSSAGLQPGMVASARILSGVYKNQLYTSINNISEQYDRKYIYTVNADNQVVRKEIQTGRVIGENVIILSGAEPGDRIVTTGAENLEDGVTVQVRS